MPRRDAQGRDTPLRRERREIGRWRSWGREGGNGSHPHSLWPLTDRKRTQRKRCLIDRDIWGTWDSLVSPLLFSGWILSCLMPKRSRQKKWFLLFHYAIGKPFHRARAQKHTLNLFAHPYLRCGVKKATRFCCSLFPPKSLPVSFFIPWTHALTHTKNTFATLKYTIGFPTSVPRELSDENPNWQA